MCKSCHYKVHNNELTIRGYKDTANGRVIDYEFVDQIKAVKTVNAVKAVNKVKAVSALAPPPDAEP